MNPCRRSHLPLLAPRAPPGMCSCGQARPPVDDPTATLPSASPLPSPGAGRSSRLTSPLRGTSGRRLSFVFGIRDWTGGGGRQKRTARGRQGTVLSESCGQLRLVGRDRGQRPERGPGSREDVSGGQHLSMRAGLIWVNFPYIPLRMSLASIGKGNGNPLPYSCLKNPVDRGAWRPTVQRVAKRGT